MPSPSVHTSDIECTGQERILTECVHQAYCVAPRVFLPAVLLSLLLAMGVWHQVSHAWLITWMIALVMCYAIRVVDWRRYHAMPATQRDAGTWRRHMRMLAGINGLIWGLAAALPSDQENRVSFFAGFVLAGVSAGAVPGMSSVPRAAIAFVAGCIAPFAVHAFALGGMHSMLTGFMAVLFAAVMMITIVSTHARIETVIRQQLQLAQRDAQLAVNLQQLQWQQQINDTVALVQSRIMHNIEPQSLFAQILDEVMRLTGSRGGFIAEVARDDHGAPCSGHCARSGTLQDSAASARVNRSHLDELLAECIRTGEAVVINHAGNDSLDADARDGMQMQSFLGMPLYAQQQLVGVLGLADRADGFDAALISQLHSVQHTIGQIMLGVRNEQLRRAANDSLRKTKTQLHNFITYAPAAVAMFDGDLRYIAYSRRWLSDHGLPETSIISRNYFEVMPDTTNMMRDAFASTLVGELQSNDQYPYIRNDGQVRWFRWEMRPWYEDNGSLGGVVMYSEDITEAKRANDALLARERLLDKLGAQVPGVMFQGRWRPGAGFRFTFVSVNAEKLCGFTARQICEQPQMYLKLFDAPERARLRKAAQVAASRAGGIHLQLRMRALDQTMRWVQIDTVAERLADASILWYGYIEDVSLRHQMALQLAQWTAQPEYPDRTSSAA